MMEFRSILSFETSFQFRLFDCGEANLNKYIRTHALLNDKNNLSKTFILLEDDSVIGFVTLCNAQIEFKDMPLDYQNNMPRYPVPAIRIARLAIDKQYQHKGYGKKLLAFAFKKIVQVSQSTGIKVVLVDAKEESKAFYEKYGFIKLNNNTYIMAIETIINALLGL